MAKKPQKVITLPAGRSKRQSADSKSTSRHMSARLSRLIARDAALKKTQTGARLKQSDQRTFIEGKTRIIFHTHADAKEAMRRLPEYGADILVTRSGLISVECPLGQVEAILDNVDGIASARLPFRAYPAGVVSEGVNLTGASTFHSSGYHGEGVRIAVLDVGFLGLSEAQENGELPHDIITRDYSGRGLETQYKHGTACAEIIHDMVPEAELHLMKLADEVDFYVLLDYLKRGGIDIVSGSIGWYGTGPGNGAGPICEAADELRDNGILVVVSAGNAANDDIHGQPYGTHWEGMYLDTNGDQAHEFVRGNAFSWYNAILGFPYQDDEGNPEPYDVTVVLRWDDWPNATIDYDLYLHDFYTDELIAYSAAIQDGSQSPVEVVAVDLPDEEEYPHYYYIVVEKYSVEPGDVEIEFFLGGMATFIPFDDHLLPISTSESSIMEPADAESVLAVGAINHANWHSGPQERFSSQGPTNAWAGRTARIKPDVSGPDGTSGHTYGEAAFLGTSAAAPHVSGASALILSMHPNLRVDELKAAIESTALDMGPEGKDNYYGFGRLHIQPYNNPPSFSPIGDMDVDEGQLLSLALPGSDPERDNLSYAVFDLPPGATFDTATGEFSWTPGESQSGTYAIRFEVTDGIDTDAATVSVTVMDVLPREADLSVTKTVDWENPKETDTIVYTVSVTNAGPDDATGVAITDQLPEEIAFVSAAETQGSYLPSSGVWTVGDLSRDGNATLTITATVDLGTAGSTILNIAAVTESGSVDPVPRNNADAERIEVVSPAADLSLRKTVDTAAPKENDTVLYTIVLTNKGPDNADGVTVTDTLPGGISFVTATATQGSYLSPDGIWTVGSLAVDDSVTLTIAATVDSGTGGTSIINTARSESSLGDPVLMNSIDFAGITVVSLAADLSISMVVDTSAPSENGSVTCTIILTNKGPDSADGIAVTDMLPAGISFASAVETQGTYSSSTGVWTVGSLAEGENATLTIAATVDAGTVGETIPNLVSITASSLDDPVAANNSSSVDIFVSPDNPGDIDNSGSIDDTDVLLMLDIIFGTKTPTLAEFARANVDASNQAIDISDLLSLIDAIQ